MSTTLFGGEAPVVIENFGHYSIRTIAGFSPNE